jgi:hypothetical protein
MCHVHWAKFCNEVYYCCLKSFILTILMQNLTIVLLVIIKLSLAEVNVSCTVPSFVNLVIPAVDGIFTQLIQNLTIMHVVSIEPSLAEINVSGAL